MSLGVGRNDDGDDEERSSGSEGDDPSFDEDMEALRRACVLTGKDFPAAAGGAGGIGGVDAALPDSDTDDDDLELVRRLQSRFFGSEDLSHALSRGPLAARPPTTMSDEEEDDFETLRAIQRRFCAYDQNTTEDCKNCFSTAARENELSDAVMVNKASGCENFPDNKDTHNSYHTLNNINGHSVITECQKPPHKQPQVKYSSFPKSGQVFIDAIKKNRSCQKLLRSKLIQIEARIEEIKKLKERVKILKDFQISCRQRTGKALSQKKDPRVQLISARRTPKDSKVNDKKLSAMYFGPAENSHVASYRMALMKFPISLQRNKWSEVERENLEKGIKQQFQEMLLQISLNFFSASDGELCNFEDILSSIKDLEITSERMREFLPKVNWNQLASMYLPGRSGAECEARWLNWEDPLINQGRWTTQEDKLLLFIIQEKGINNWVDIAVSLGTNRTPFQCLSRYQRSLNACIIKSAWTPEEDAQLRAAVETFGESNWQAVASVLEGRTGTQCSNRWMKTLHPNRQRVGRWTKDEDARLRVAVKLFGAKNWRKIADFVPGRTQVQCRERWVNSLDPSLNWNQWTAEEDAMLEAAIGEHGYCWSKIAVCLSPRTDNQCRRRWKLLFPEEVPLLRQARKIQKAALIRNFVDRESERPGLGPGDFLPVPTISSVSNSQSVKPPRKPKSGSSGSEKVGSKRKRKTRPLNSDQVIEGNNEVVAGALAKHVVKPCSGKSRKPPQGRNSRRQHLQEQSLPQLDSTMLVTANSETTKIHGMPDIAKQGEIANRVQKVRCRRPRKEGQLNCEKVLDNYAAENCNLVLETRKAKKQGSREGRQSRRAKKHLSSPSNSVSTSLIHDESPQVLGMSDHTEKEENVISRVADTGKKSRVNGQCSSHQVLQIVNCKEDDRVTECGIVSRKRKVTKPCLREDDHGEPSKGCLPSPPHSSSLVVGKTIEVHGMSDITETRKNSRAKKETVSNKTKEDSHSRFNHSGDADKICMDAVTTDKDFKVYQRRRNLALDRCHNDSSSGPAVPAPPGNSCSLSLGFNEDEAEIRMTGNEPVSCQVPEIYDGDDTLASFLVKKQKKAGRIFKAGNRPALSSPSAKACLGAGKMPMNAGDKLGNSPSSLACSNDGAEMAMTGKESVSCPVLETDDCDDTLINFLVKKQNKGGGMLSAENRPAMSCPNSKACPGAGKMPMNAGD